MKIGKITSRKSELGVPEPSELAAGGGKLSRPPEGLVQGVAPHFVDIFVVRIPGTRRASMLLDILASLLGIDGHLNHHGSLVVELVHKLLPVLLFLQCGVKSQAAALPDELAVIRHILTSPESNCPNSPTLTAVLTLELMR